MYQTISRAFTLIEMLIVIVIIGILAAALVPRLQSIQSRARDTDRKIDFKALYDANEIHRMDFGQYSPMNGCAINETSCSSNSLTTGYWIAGLSGYMTSIPRDPINNGVWPYDVGKYSYLYYRVLNTPVHTYALLGSLENTSDPDRCTLKNYRSMLSTGGTYLLRCSFHGQTYAVSPNVGNPNY